MKRGDFVSVTYAGRTCKAMVLIASENGRSLMLGFSGVLGDGDGLYLGSMPVLQDESGVYRDLVKGESVTIEPLPRDEP